MPLYRGPRRTLLGAGRRGGLSSAQQATLALLKAARTAAAASNAVDNADMALPPTITYASTTNAALATAVYPTVTPSSFWITKANVFRRLTDNRMLQGHNSLAPSTGGNLGGAGGAQAGLFSPEIPSTGYDNSNEYEVSFSTSAPKVEIELRAVGGGTFVPYRVIVNDQYVVRDGLNIQLTSQAFVTLDFGSAAARNFTVEIQGGQRIGGIRTTSGYALSAPSGTPLYAAAVGDSQTEALNMGTYGGSTKFWQWDGWARAFCRKNGLLLTNSALGGTGYWNQSGGVPGTRSNIYTQMDYWLAFTSWSAIIFAGGYNDAGQVSDSTIRTLARTAWEKARTNAPQALIIVLGVFSGRTVTSDSSSRVVTEAALKAEFDSWADRFSMWIPVSPSYAGAWVNGSGYEGATTGVGNADTYVSTDGVHYNRSGHLYNAGKASTDYRTKLDLIA